MVFETFEIKTKHRNQLINITDQVKQVITKSKTKEGVCIIYVPHATAAIMLFENYDPALPSGHPFTNVQFSFYVSSTIYAGFSGYVLGVPMQLGGVYYADKSKDWYVWPVRDPL